MMAESLPEICRVVIPIKLEFSASVGFIHKESVTTHGHTIVKKVNLIFQDFFENLSIKFMLDWNLTRVTGTLHEDRYTLLIISRSFFLEWEMFQTKVVEKTQTHILCSISFFFQKSFRLWDNVEKYGRFRQATDNNMAHEHCIPDS